MRFLNSSPKVPRANYGVKVVNKFDNVELSGYCGKSFSSFYF